tara:strand:- start:474 stop:1376 length:903 start_codon:yes stop_codon:yes gene_type:complete
MNKFAKHLMATFFCIAIALSFTYILSQEIIEYKNYSMILIACLVIFFIQWIVFIPSYFFHTEKFFDITGGITYILTVVLIVYLKLLQENFDIQYKDIVILFMVIIWAMRLSLFLFFRVLHVGHDSRFTEIKKSFSNFLMVWTIQALWIYITLLTTLTCIASGNVSQIDIFMITGSIVWVFGFFIEIISDQQKNNFKAMKINTGQFISSGLWSVSRHPNYVGEIILWVGITIIALPALSGLQYISLVSPIFVYILLSRVSGVNLLEVQAEERWGMDIKYQEYKKQTPVLFPSIIQLIKFFK